MAKKILKFFSHPRKKFSQIFLKFSKKVLSFLSLENYVMERLGALKLNFRSRKPKIRFFFVFVKKKIENFYTCSGAVKGGMLQKKILTPQKWLKLIFDTKKKI